MIVKRIISGTTAFALSVTTAMSPFAALANPQDGVVSGGSATITENGTKLDVLQITSKAVIDWRSFDIGVDEHTQFYQPSSGSVALNRVNSADPSSILGKLSANGKIILINPNGVFFGAGSVIDVSGLVASTADISNSDFMNNSVLNFNIAGAPDAKIINEGLITAKDAGLVGLVAPQIENSGIIRANLGKVELASGDTFTLDMYGDKLIEVAVSNTIASQIIKSSGTITADGGSVVITAAAAGGIVDSIIDISGEVAARAYMGSNGEIILEAKGDGTNTGRNTVIVTGDLDATDITMKGSFVENTGNLNGTDIDIDGYNVSNQGSVTSTDNIAVTYDNLYMDSAASSMTGKYISLTGDAGSANFISGTYDASGDTGGNIDIFATNINLFGATLDATGTNGGGYIRIGGDYQGGGSMLKADTTTINQFTTIDASAVISGNGGTAIVWSEDKTNFAGSIYAKGGSVSGNGGLIELSSKEVLDVFTNKAADASAANGIAGSVLLDPKNIIISNAGLSGGGMDFFQFVDPNADTGSFGGNIKTLSNGNIVIADTGDDFAVSNAGAVYLFDGATGGLISTLRGTSSGDQVGSHGIVELTNGNYLVDSNTFWDNGGVSNAGAVTWASGTAGVAGTVSAANSLVGTSMNDQVGQQGVVALTNGNYVIASNGWDNGGISNAGAATWGNGTTGTVGAVSSANSLVGSTSSDRVGHGGVTALTNGNYVVNSYVWNNGGANEEGAVTWGNGATGITGTVSGANSLIGSNAFDQVGFGGVTALTNGNYVVVSKGWSNGLGGGSDAGAVTWGNGATGITGVVSQANSLYGVLSSDSVGRGGVTALTNGNYVVVSDAADLGLSNNGAVTWGDGTTGITGAVSTSNSLYGSTASDQVGQEGVVALSNGNYVVTTLQWGASDEGAVTWGDGTTGITGAVSSANSLVGSQANDFIGNGGITALTNGNYVVASNVWDNGGVANAGAVTWGDGTTGITGAVSTANSLYGTTASDQIGMNGITALTNGNYVVSSKFWDNGGTADVGAATWGNGTTGTVGAVSTTNSLYGTKASDEIGATGAVALTNGNYVVRSHVWDNGGILNAGAVTWGNGATGITGIVSSANSLVGSTAHDRVGEYAITALSNGNYVVANATWDDGGIADAGAFTLGNGTTGVTGTIDSTNSIIGGSAGAGANSTVLEDTVNGRYIVKFTNSQEVFSSNVNGSVTVDTAFAQNSSGDANINPIFLTNTLNTGSNLTLQASNDITVNDDVIVNNAGGDGGDLTLQAGRSLLLNADIFTDNGDLTLIANEILANGVVDAERDAGAAVITMAGGTSINAGTGDVQLLLRDGVGKTNLASGDVSLQAITANSILVENLGVNAGDIILNGVLNASAAGNALTLATLGDFTNNAGASALTTAAGRSLVYSTTPENNTPGGLTGTKRYNKTYTGYAPGSVVENGDVFLYSVAPTLNVTADSVTRALGESNPSSFTYNISGFIDGDTTTSALSGSPIFSTTAGTSSAMGNYAIAGSPGTLASQLGYQFNFVNGQLTVAAPDIPDSAQGSFDTQTASTGFVSKGISKIMENDLFGQDNSFDKPRELLFSFLSSPNKEELHENGDNVRQLIAIKNIPDFTKTYNHLITIE